MDHRARQPRGDLRLERLGAAFDQRDHEVVRLGHPGEPILDIEPDLGVIDMRHHEHAGVRPRAFRSLGRRRAVASSGRASNGLAAVTSPPGGGTAGGKSPAVQNVSGVGLSANRPGSCRIRRRASRAPAAAFRRGAVIRHDAEVRSPSICRRYSSLVASRCATRRRRASFSSRSASRRSSGSNGSHRQALYPAPAAVGHAVTRAGRRSPRLCRVSNATAPTVRRHGRACPARASPRCRA